jgi:hypothetical protein
VGVLSAHWVNRCGANLKRGPAIVLSRLLSGLTTTVLLDPEAIVPATKRSTIA